MLARRPFENQSEKYIDDFNISAIRLSGQKTREHGDGSDPVQAHGAFPWKEKESGPDGAD